MADIPLEARMVAVADVYDALSNARPYKQAWTEDQIVQELNREVALGRLDGECVQALMSAAAERAEIQKQFKDQPQ
jgi:HD-GYP domain-containing protein (c-di-GMP phosphodiesterase class II)